MADLRYLPCPYCGESDLPVDEWGHVETDDGKCPGCDRYVDFDPVDGAAR